MAWTLDGRYDSAAEDRYIKLERTSVDLTVRLKKLSDDSLVGKITIPLADLGAFRAMLASCCNV